MFPRGFRTQERAERLVRGRTADHLRVVGTVRIDPFNRRNIKRRGEIVADRVHDRQNADPVERRAAKNRNAHIRKDRLAHDRTDHLFGDLLFGQKEFGQFVAEH